ncbi:hypothetical protein SAY86_021591 [Trapa natans]|uniref:Protein PHYTOCHROME KINASE SUBSTRATE 1-like n=1 Tax=Trapa natans TaxID=22666 RepID=A0AAN7MA17_TRANT|nr:hypothetical protein SAY86_021591 [Trapa natans]
MKSLPFPPPAFLRSSSSEFDKMEAENTVADLRTASFAVYINAAQESLVKRLTEPVHPGKVVPKDGEIGVFGAEKYSTMSIDYDHGDNSIDMSRKGGNHRLDPMYGGGSKMGLPGSPSISSESSSWAGSHTSFLRSIQRSLSINGQRRRRSSFGDHRRFFAVFGCKKSCTDRKSIHVSDRGSRRDETAVFPSKTKSKSHSQRCDSKRMEPFAFPVLINKASSDEVEPPRRSIEVFGSKAGRKRTEGAAVEMNLERKLSMLTWDAIPKAQQQVLLRNNPPRVMDFTDDMGSEASSELFEIEHMHISGGTATRMPPSMTHCYEPSEASIEWSVVTASQADFSSVLSEYDEKEVVADARGRNDIAPRRTCR